MSIPSFHGSLDSLSHLILLGFPYDIKSMMRALNTGFQVQGILTGAKTQKGHRVTAVQRHGCPVEGRLNHVMRLK